MKAFPEMDVFDHIEWLNEQVKALGLEEPNDESFVRKFIGEPRRQDGQPPK